MDDLPRRDPESVREAFREYLRRLAKAVLIKIGESNSNANKTASKSKGTRKADPV